MREAEAAWARLVIPRETVGQVLGEPRGDGRLRSRLLTSGRCRRLVRCPPQRCRCGGTGLAQALAPDYQRIMDALDGRGGSGGDAKDCRQLAAALGLEPVPAKVEGKDRVTIPLTVPLTPLSSPDTSPRSTSPSSAAITNVSPTTPSPLAAAWST